LKKPAVWRVFLWPEFEEDKLYWRSQQASTILAGLLKTNDQ